MLWNGSCCKIWFKYLSISVLHDILDLRVIVLFHFYLVDRTVDRQNSRTSWFLPNEQFYRGWGRWKHPETDSFHLQVKPLKGSAKFWALVLRFLSRLFWLPGHYLSGYRANRLKPRPWVPSVPPYKCCHFIPTSGSKIIWWGANRWWPQFHCLHR